VSRKETECWEIIGLATRRGYPFLQINQVLPVPWFFHYQDQEEEFNIARELIQARTRIGLTQEEVARRMGTTQSAVARMESGKPLPSLRSLKRYAQATGSKIKISLET
jgi:DNA-binding XRE family transcriptional regulator